MESKVSVQDEFLALANAAIEIKNNVQTRLAEAPKELGQLLQAIWSLFVILSELRNHTGDPALTDTQKTTIQKIQADCRNALADTQCALNEHSSFSVSTAQYDAFNLFYDFETTERETREGATGRREIDELRERISSISSALDAAITEPNREILDWLVPHEYTTGKQSKYISKRATGTYQWFLDSPDYQTWNSTKGNTLFCHGGLGVGKSVLASTVIASLQERSVSENGTVVCYFYYAASRADEQSIIHVLLAMLWQLVYHMTSIPEPVMDIFHQAKTLDGRPSFNEARGAFCDVASGFSRLFIVIDAVDGYQSSGNGLGDIMSALLSLQTEVGANMFLTSRTIPRIVELSPGYRWIKFRPSDRDIAQFVEESVLRLPDHVKLSSSRRDEVINKIVRDADGVFIHAQLRVDVLKDIRHPKKRNLKRKSIKNPIDEALSRCLVTMDEIYEETWQRICNQIPSQRHIAIKTLSWVVYSKRHLTRTELQHALSIQINESESSGETVPTIEDIESSCFGFLALDQESDLVRLIHCTAADYLNTLFLGGEIMPCPKTMLTETCITYLSFNVFGSGRCGSDVEFEERLACYPFYNYASSNWGHHAILGNSLDEVRMFLGGRSLVEASCQALFSVKLNEDDHGYSQRAPEYPWSIYMSETFGLAQLSKDWGNPWEDDALSIADFSSNGRTGISSLQKYNRESLVRLILEYGAKIECQNNPDTPLVHASKHGNVKIAQLLLNGGHSIELGDFEKNTALLHAAARGHEAVVELLLNHGTSVKKKRNTSFGFGEIQRYDELVRSLLETLARTQLPDNIRSDVIAYAIERDHYDIVQILFKPDEWKIYMLEKLQSLVRENRHLDIIRLLNLDSTLLPSADVYYWAINNLQSDVILSLLQRGPRERFGEVSWEQILLVAIENGNITLTQMILNSSPQISYWRDDRGRTVLFYACDFGKKDIVKALLDDYNAEINAQCSSGRTPLLSAAYNRQYDVVDILLSYEKVQVDKSDHLGRGVLSVASEQGHIVCVKRLLKCSQIDPDSADGLGRTPLSWAAGNGHSRIIDLLVSTRLVDVNYADVDGRTPLIWTCSQQHEEAASRLLFAGCDAELRNKSRQTALHVAAQAGSDAICKLLIEKVDPDVFDRNEDTALILALENDHHKVRWMGKKQSRFIRQMNPLDGPTLPTLIRYGALLSAQSC
ncbi:hypothetical protein G7054_g10898 [Neopestalotiopsis clavispora]|nr:hypothetical protein G7054_g10898 [Neopestalotiopsis clavispora]